MKFGVNTWFSEDTQLKTALEAARKFGFEGVDLNGDLREFSEQDIRRLLEQNRLEVVAVTTGPPFASSNGDLDLHHRDSEVRRRSVEYVQRCLDTASGIGADLVYVVSVSKVLPNDRSNALGLFSDSLTKCCDYADSAGLRVAVEHTPRGIIDTFSLSTRVVSALGFSNLGVVLDTGHLKLTGESSENAVIEAGEMLFHVQIDDNDGKSDGHMLPAAGATQRRSYRELANRLRKSGYAGYVSLELAKLADLEAAYSADENYMESLLGMGRRSNQNYPQR